MIGTSDFSLFLGRLHPLFVHLPIGIILLLAILEWFARSQRFKHAGGARGIILLVAVPVAIASAFCGWLLSLGGGYDEKLVQWHMWTGIATAAACTVAGLLYWLDLQKLYRWCLVTTLLVMVVASHFGGSLTHGSDYLARYAPAMLRPWLGGAKPAPPAPGIAIAPGKTNDFSASLAFATLILPVLQKDCVECHGPEKSKGGLRLDTFAELMKGGKNGPALVAGKSADSELVKRMLLPETDDDHMPPEGKPQPGKDDLALLRWWIDSGADATKTIAELKPTPTLARIFQTRFGAPGPEPAKITPPKAIAEIRPQMEQIAGDLGISANVLDPAEPWIQINPSMIGTNFGDADLAKLAPLAANIRWLDLAGTRITDAGLVQVAAMPNLVRLHLERTAITDAGLASLAELPNLEYLNLYATTISEAGLEPLKNAPKLKQVYLWQTKVTPSAAIAFADARTDKDQLKKWQDEIEAIKGKIREAHVTVEVGVPIITATNAPASTNVAAATTNSAPINTTCPVTGKPIDLAKTVVYEGKTIAFCCDDCKASFQKDPKPILAKLQLPAPKTDGASGTATASPPKKDPDPKKD